MIPNQLDHLYTNQEAHVSLDMTALIDHQTDMTGPMIDNYRRELGRLLEYIQNTLPPEDLDNLRVQYRQNPGAAVEEMMLRYVLNADGEVNTTVLEDLGRYYQVIIARQYDNPALRRAFFVDVCYRLLGGLTADLAIEYDRPVVSEEETASVEGETPIERQNNQVRRIAPRLIETVQKYRDRPVVISVVSTEAIPELQTQLDRAGLGVRIYYREMNGRVRLVVVPEGLASQFQQKYENHYTPYSGVTIEVMDTPETAAAQALAGESADAVLADQPQPGRMGKFLRGAGGVLKGVGRAVVQLTPGVGTIYTKSRELNKLGDYSVGLHGENMNWQFMQDEDFEIVLEKTVKGPFGRGTREVEVSAVRLTDISDSAVNEGSSQALIIREKEKKELGLHHRNELEGLRNVFDGGRVSGERDALIHILSDVDAYEILATAAAEVGTAIPEYNHVVTFSAEGGFPVINAENVIRLAQIISDLARTLAAKTDPEQRRGDVLNMIFNADELRSLANCRVINIEDGDKLAKLGESLQRQESRLPWRKGEGRFDNVGMLDAALSGMQAGVAWMGLGMAGARLVGQPVTMNLGAKLASLGMTVSRAAVPAIGDPSMTMGQRAREFGGGAMIAVVSGVVGGRVGGINLSGAEGAVGWVGRFATTALGVKGYEMLMEHLTGEEVTESEAQRVRNQAVAWLALASILDMLSPRAQDHVQAAETSDSSSDAKAALENQVNSLQLANTLETQEVQANSELADISAQIASLQASVDNGTANPGTLDDIRGLEARRTEIINGIFAGWAKMKEALQGDAQEVVNGLLTHLGIDPAATASSGHIVLLDSFGHSIENSVGGAGISNNPLLQGATSTVGGGMSRGPLDQITHGTFHHEGTGFTSTFEETVRGLPDAGGANINPQWIPLTHEEMTRGLVNFTAIIENHQTMNSDQFSEMTNWMHNMQVAVNQNTTDVHQLQIQFEQFTQAFNNSHTDVTIGGNVFQTVINQNGGINVIGDHNQIFSVQNLGWLGKTVLIDAAGFTPGVETTLTCTDGTTVNVNIVLGADGHPALLGRTVDGAVCVYNLVQEQQIVQHWVSGTPAIPGSPFVGGGGVGGVFSGLGASDDLHGSLASWINEAGARAAVERGAAVTLAEELLAGARHNPDALAQLHVVDSSGNIDPEALVNRVLHMNQLVGPNAGPGGLKDILPEGVSYADVRDNPVVARQVIEEYVKRINEGQIHIEEERGVGYTTIAKFLGGRADLLHAAAGGGGLAAGAPAMPGTPAVPGHMETEIINSWRLEPTGVCYSGIAELGIPTGLSEADLLAALIDRCICFVPGGDKVVERIIQENGTNSLNVIIPLLIAVLTGAGIAGAAGLAGGAIGYALGRQRRGNNNANAAVADMPLHDVDPAATTVPAQPTQQIVPPVPAAANANAGVNVNAVGPQAFDPLAAQAIPFPAGQQQPGQIANAAEAPAVEPLTPEQLELIGGQELMPAQAENLADAMRMLAIYIGEDGIDADAIEPGIANNIRMLLAGQEEVIQQMLVPLLQAIPDVNANYAAHHQLYALVTERILDRDFVAYDVNGLPALVGNMIMSIRARGTGRVNEEGQVVDTLDNEMEVVAFARDLLMTLAEILRIDVEESGGESTEISPERRAIGEVLVRAISGALPGKKILLPPDSRFRQVSQEPSGEEPGRPESAEQPEAEEEFEGAMQNVNNRNILGIVLRRLSPVSRGMTVSNDPKALRNFPGRPVEAAVALAAGEYRPFLVGLQNALRTYIPAETMDYQGLAREYRMILEDISIVDIFTDFRTESGDGYLNHILNYLVERYKRLTNRESIPADEQIRGEIAMLIHTVLAALLAAAQLEKAEPVEPDSGDGKPPVTPPAAPEPGQVNSLITPEQRNDLVERWGDEALVGTLLQYLQLAYPELDDERRDWLMSFDPSTIPDRTKLQEYLISAIKGVGDPERSDTDKQATIDEISEILGIEDVPDATLLPTAPVQLGIVRPNAGGLIDEVGINFGRLGENADKVRNQVVELVEYILALPNEAGRTSHELAMALLRQLLVLFGEQRAAAADTERIVLSLLQRYVSIDTGNNEANEYLRRRTVNRILSLFRIKGILVAEPISLLGRENSVRQGFLQLEGLMLNPPKGIKNQEVEDLDLRVVSSLGSGNPSVRLSLQQSLQHLGLSNEPQTQVLAIRGLNALAKR